MNGPKAKQAMDIKHDESGTKGGPILLRLCCLCPRVGRTNIAWAIPGLLDLTSVCNENRLVATRYRYIVHAS
jgi:hypothetical protein